MTPPLYNSDGRLITRGLNSDSRVLNGNLSNSDQLGGIAPLPSVNTHALDFERGALLQGDVAGYLITGGEAIDQTGAMTAELWFNAESTPSVGANYTLASVWGPAAPLLDWALFLTNVAGVVYFDVLISDNGTNFQRQRWTWAAPDTGAPHHVGWSWNTAGTQATQHNVTLDGVDQGAGSIITSRTMSSHAGANTYLLLGGLTSIFSPFNRIHTWDGILDDFRLWSTVRTPAELAANRSAELTPPVGGLVGYYKLNNNYVDSANGYDMSGLFGPPIFVSPLF